MKKPITTKKDLVAYMPDVDLKQFKLTREPTVDALANDVEKFAKIGDSGIDMHILGTFLCGVSLIKLKKMVGNASRGATAKGEDGWTKFRAEHFPHRSSDSLLNRVHFVNNVFAEAKAKNRTGSVFANPLDFEMPENPDELKGLLTAIHNAMDGKTVTALYRGSGRIREAIAPGTNSNGRGPARDDDDEDETDFIDGVRADIAGLCDEDDDALAKYPAAKRDKLELACRGLLQRILEIKRKAGGAA